ncbi:MFS transporter [Paenibacillus selenitireducens]|uniref:MFS transporter n=1 Tax=Paenibacillus selenitireducens TaxID=1324314 RepID=A0A1T2XN23_9BACL|nr:MFS transporter [Paenibacillus selenitireducens]OPA81136.1 MFS transporter [Paenibacillus selenitireducens]
MSTKTKSKKLLSITFESDIESVDDQTVQKKSSNETAAGKGQMMIFIALASVPLVMVLGNSMLVPILPQLQQQLHISKFQSSLVISIFSIASAIVIPVTGYLADRYTRKMVLVPALILYGGAGILGGFAAAWGSYPILITARALQGIGAAGTAPIAMALVGDLFKDATESKALGLIEASNGSGKVVSPILGSLLALLVWYAAFFAFPVFCAVALVMVIWFIKEPKKQNDPLPLKQYIHTIGTIFKKKGRWLISSFFVGSLALFILFGILFYLSNILEKAPYNIDGVIKGLVLAIPLLGMVTTSYISGSIIKKSGVLIRWFTNVGLILMTVALACAIFFNQNIYVFIGLLTLSSIGTGLLLPCLNTMITGAVDKGERGMITSLYNSLRFIGVAIGPPLFGWMMDISHQTIFITVSALSLAGLALSFFLIKPDKTVK